MSLSLFRRPFQTLLRCEPLLRSIPTLSPTCRCYRADRGKEGEPEWNTVTQHLPAIFAVQNAEQRWLHCSKEFALRLSRPPTAYSGRSVSVTNGDIGEASRKLDRIMFDNNVWKELRLTQRHERKGVKRRRLSSQRWRTRFKEEVRKKVELVKEIRRRGS